MNAILDGKPYINSVKLEPTEYKKSTPDGKSIRLDIAAVADDGTLLNVEIQCKNEGNVEDRASFYKARRNSYLRTYRIVNNVYKQHLYISNAIYN